MKDKKVNIKKEVPAEAETVLADKTVVRNDFIEELIIETTFNLGALGVLYVQEGTTARSCEDIERELADSMGNLPRKMVWGITRRIKDIFLELAKGMSDGHEKKI